MTAPTAPRAIHLRIGPLRGTPEHVAGVMRWAYTPAGAFWLALYGLLTSRRTRAK